ncbi:MAG: N-acetylmuramoyl-L-alanine amidase [Armatimonadia bacterium]
MKKLITTLLLLSLCAVACAEPTPPPAPRLMVAGKTVSLSPAASLQGSQLIVPWSTVATACGAKANWNATSGTLRLTSARGKVLTAAAGAKSFTCDGREVSLPVPLRVTDGQLLGPLGPLVDALDAVLQWNPQKRLAQVWGKVVKLETRGDDDGVTVTAITSLPVTSSLTLVDGPRRAFFDLPGTYLGPQRAVNYLNLAGAMRVRSGQFTQSPPLVRIVADLTPQGPAAAFEPREDRCGGRLLIGKIHGDEPVIERNAPRLTKVLALSRGKDTTIVNAYLTDPLEPVYDVMRQPYRVLVDLAGADVTHADTIMPESVPFVDEVRVLAQGRLVFYMGELVPFTVKLLDNPTRVQIVFQRDKLAGKTIMVDAGHGGKDSGARGRKLMEKDVNLDVARRTAQRLALMDAKPYLTRDSDVFIDLYARPRMTNQLPADLFVSVHCNAGSRRDQGAGTQTYFCHPQSKNLATIMQDSLAPLLGREDDGVFKARFCVIRETKIPAVLVELLFIDNLTEENLLSQSSIRDKAALGISEGIRRYYEGSKSLRPALLTEPSG